jgi:ABC-type transport system involved in Fe-S cluster assembly fused permease/ATPase subunit
MDYIFPLFVPCTIALFFIGSVYREVRQSLIDMEQMFQLRDTKPQIQDKPNAIPYNPNTMGTTIRFEKVHFAYPSASGSSSASSTTSTTHTATTTTTKALALKPRGILNGTTLEIPAGKTVAIVGSSGCGKSTILRLLYRFYDPDEGRITIGDVDVTDFTKESVQKAIAVVPQDVVLFHETIKYNIQYGNLSASWDQVVDAARKAKIHDAILRFPEGYDTIVGERGLKLSGGEKQRVSIARAILKDAPIFLCDEPTSSLDSETESDIMNNLKEVGKTRTTLIIAHRLSTVQDCDEIIVMDQGHVVERGTHESLLALGGRYTELQKMQQHLDQNDDDDDDNDGTNHEEKITSSKPSAPP